jgi:hypothetical protein
MFAIGEHGDTLTMLYGLDLPHLESLKMLIQPRGSGYFLADLVEDPCRSIQMPHLQTFALVMSTRGYISLIWDVIKIMVSSCDRLNRIVLDGIHVDVDLRYALRNLLGRPVTLFSSDPKAANLNVASWTRYTSPALRAVAFVELSVKLLAPWEMMVYGGPQAHGADIPRCGVAQVENIKSDGVMVKSVTRIDVHCDSTLCDTQEKWLQDVYHATHRTIV